MCVGEVGLGGEVRAVSQVEPRLREAARLGFMQALVPRHALKGLKPPKGIDAVTQLLGIPLYDVEETGYPERMRKKIEQERILRKRAEQKERRAKFERGENPYS